MYSPLPHSTSLRFGRDIRLFLFWPLLGMVSPPWMMCCCCCFAGGADDCSSSKSKWKSLWWLFISRCNVLGLFFLFFCVFDAVCMGFLMVLAGRPPSAAICVFFWFSCVFDAMCMGFAIDLADRPTDNLNSRSQQVISTVDFSR